ncbi:MAG: septal ring lytic transglycosylase RlpA family protein [Magnetococcales bacterium]|nr:septal ring lytic transglycosylase RlpA family protein [Magnetococcales bacterium]
MRAGGFQGVKRAGWLLLLLFVAACARIPEKPESAPSAPSKSSVAKRGTSRPYEVFGKIYYPLTEEEAAGYSEEGMASWYGREFHDRPTANGERFDMNKVSAAHTVLPLPMLVRVTNLDNGRFLDVRVNDRGPFVDNRLIDLSYAAAVELGYANRGLARVRVQALSMQAKADTDQMYRPRTGTPPSPLPTPGSARKDLGLESRESKTGKDRQDTPWKETSSGATGGATGGGSGLHYLQVGSFGRYENAQAVERRLQKIGKPKIIKSSVGARIMYRVRLGPFTTAEQAEQTERAVRKMEIGEAVIIRD